MTSSGEVAAMFTAQNEQFMGRNVFANSFGVASPYQSMGAYGRGPIFGGFQQVPGGFPGMAGPPPVWSYGAGPLAAGYAGGNSFSAGMMSGLGGAATLGVAGLGMAAGFGKLGGMGSLMFDPISSGMRGFSAARTLGSGVMGGIGAGAVAALPATMIAAGMTHGISSFVGGAQGQSAIAGQVGQQMFVNPASRTGMGFTRDDAKAFGDSVRQIAHVPEMLTSVEELTRLLPQLRKAGSFQGVKDITEFQERFKDSVKTIKTMSKMLGTTMEEAAEFFTHSKSVGFLGKQAQLQNVLNAQYTSGMTGMSMEQTMGLQQSGAAAFRSQGISGRIGAQAYTNWAQQLGYAQQSGVLAEGALEDMTGLQGPQAVAAAAQRFGNAAFSMTQNTAVGRLLTYGMMSFDKNGKATGVDAELLEKFKRGEVSYHELKARAGSLTDTQKVSATARLKDVGGLLAGAGPDAMVRVLQDALTERFGDSTKGREALNLMLQRNAGLSANESDILMGQVGDEPSGAGRSSFMRNQMMRSAQKEQYSPSAMWKRFKTKASKAMGFTALEQMGADMQTDFAKAYEEFWDDLLDRNVLQVSKEGAQAFKASMGGNDSELKKMFADAHGLKESDLVRSSNRWTAGRVARTAVGAVVGLGVGAFTGGIGGGIAAAGTMAAFDASGATDALDRWFTGGMSKEEVSRIEDQGRMWNSASVNYGGLGGDQDVWKTRGRASVVNLLASQGALGEDAGGRGAAIRKGAGDYYTKLLSDQLGVSEWQASTGLHQFWKGGSDFSGLDFNGSDIEKAAKNNPELAAFLTSMKQNAGGAKNLNEAAAAAAAGMGSGLAIDHSLVAGLSKEDMLRVKNIDAMKASISNSFSEMGIDAGLQSSLGKSEKAREILSALSDDKNPAVKAAILSGDPAELEKAGIKGATADDIGVARRAWEATQSDPKYKEVSKKNLAKVLADSGKIGSLEQVKALSMASKDAYNDFSNVLSKAGLTGKGGEVAERLKAALNEMGEGSDDAGKFFSGRKSATKAIEDLVKHASGLKGKELEEFTGKLGRFGVHVRDAVGRSTGKMNLGVLADQSGFAKGSDDLNKLAEEFGVTEKGMSDPSRMVELQGRIAAIKSGGDIAAAGSTHGKANKDNEVITTLKAMQKNSELQTSLLSVLAKDKGGAKVIEGAGGRVNENGQVVFVTTNTNGG